MEVRNSDGMTVWVPNEAFEFIQKIWKPEYQWAPVPVDKSLARAPEQIAFIRAPTPDPSRPAAPAAAPAAVPSGVPAAVPAPRPKDPSLPADEPKPAPKPSVLQAFRSLVAGRKASAPSTATKGSEPQPAPETAQDVPRSATGTAGGPKPSAPPPVPQHARVPALESRTLTAPPIPQTPNVIPGTPRTPRTPRTPLPPIETSLPKQLSRTSRGSPGTAELETAITAISSLGDTDSVQTPSTATEIESPRTPRDSIKLRGSYAALPLPSIVRPPGTNKPALQLSRLEYLGNDNYEPPKGPWPSLDDWRAYQQENQWRGYQGSQNLHPGGWEAVEKRRALPMPGELSSPPGPWKLEDGRGNYRPKAGTRAAAWKTLDGSRHELNTNDKFVSSMTTDTAWHGSEKGFALRTDRYLNIEVHINGNVSGDITLSSEALFAL